MHGRASTNKGGMQGLSQMWLVQGKRARDRDAGKRRRSQNEASSASNPSAIRSKHTDELKANIATQDQTISTFRSQSTSLGSSYESQVASLVESHSVEVASLKNHIRALEEQIGKHGLHHASGNNSPSVLYTIETPHTPIHETAQVIADTVSTSSIESESKQRSPQRLASSVEMENLKRKLSSTRRPETTTRNLLPELNLYKQNNVALQQQIESLMAKLNDSKKSERELRNILGMTEMKCAEFEDKATHADKLAKSMQALQNTIDHLESRLEIANTKRLDAEEQLSNLRNDKSPFDLSSLTSQVPSSADPTTFGPRIDRSIGFSGASPTSSELDSQENSTLAAFVAHVAHLQDQVREKDLYIADLEKELQQLRQTSPQLERGHNTPAANLVTQDQSREAHRTDTYMGQLRNAVLNREAVIEEKDRDIRAIEKQLEHHKLLLQAEVRRNAAMKLHIATEADSWPELTSLARREDIDRWMDRLHERLRREQPKTKGKALIDTPDVQMETLRKEIDFYVREIILFKLDIKGYKSDMRKLKKVTAQMEAYGRTSELESEACSLRQTATPVHSQFAPPTPEFSSTSSPVMEHSHTRNGKDDVGESYVSPSPSASSRNLDYVAVVPRNSPELDIPRTLHDIALREGHAVETDSTNCRASSQTAAPRSAERPKATVRTLMVS
ncbi:hypothetical protein ACET3X_000842 [Alternaria dauci]|uniref:Uncharacterized protein n=1 Tax=Alternaria dauci TaxID=48095 RepID=A0ABR3UW42_9PLEO